MPGDAFDVLRVLHLHVDNLELAIWLDWNWVIAWSLFEIM